MTEARGRFCEMSWREPASGHYSPCTVSSSTELAQGHAAGNKAQVCGQKKMTLKQSLQHTPHSRWPAFERHWAQRKGESDTQLLPLPSVRAAEAKKTSRRRSRRQRSKAKLCQAQASREVKIRVQGS